MSNPTASTSNGNPANAAAAAAAHQIMPVAVNPANPVIQIDQKKVPVFYGEKDKDSLTVLNWCRRIDGLKTAFAWSDAATFCNATAALFGNAARIVTSWKVLDPVDYRETWTYLRKAMLNHWGDVKDSRSFIDALFALRPRTNDLDSLDSSSATSWRPSKWWPTPCRNLTHRRSSLMEERTRTRKSKPC